MADPMPVTDYYVLFFSHTSGMALYEFVRQRGIRVRISPAPRAATSCCGMSLLVEQRELEAVKACIEVSGIEIDKIVLLPRQIDPMRHKFC
ncbi:Protein of unknown function [Sporobacter termitidis DSM 10068]|uniref:Putative Se/S carrier protein-like domain-containing protein n=1 Tax=Sporobacter termitidis DSM 10068 TaxID=1123282 RepID=A0A1M5VHF1_9FIRM|nr:DUF3343 domain-containing protein [Sporobacter termitidis]SHH74656.1 Protein of unknown function [Sporobacter termitidis DSM 10068]